MKKVEIKKLDLMSVFKVTIYFMIVPFSIFALIGLITLLVGIGLGMFELITVGVIYTVMPIAIIPFYGGMAALTGLIYNLLTKKFGGLKYYIEYEENEVIPPILEKKDNPSTDS